MAVDWRYVGGVDAGDYADADLPGSGDRHSFLGHWTGDTINERIATPDD